MKTKEVQTRIERGENFEKKTQTQRSAYNETLSKAKAIVSAFYLWSKYFTVHSKNSIW